MKKIGDLVSDVDNDRLNQILDEAFKDDRFVSVVNNLVLTQKQLKENVHLIKEAIEERQNCLQCSSINECRNEILGFCQTPKVYRNQFKVDYVECNFSKTARDEKKHLQYIYSFEVPENLKKADFKSIWTDDSARFELIEYVSNFLRAYFNNERPKGAYIYGNNGSGKTHIMAAMINELAKKNVRCGIIYFPELLRSLKANFKKDYDQRYLYIRNLPVLVLDDIGAEKLTEWGRDEILSSLLQYRMQANLPTFFTSNLSLENFERHLADGSSSNGLIKSRRIIERVKSMCEKIEVEGKNLRK